MFETFNVPTFYLINTQLLELYATGRSTGIVLHVEDRVTFIVPIIDAIVQDDAVITLNIGNKDLVDYLQQILTERGYSFTTTADIYV